MTALLDFEWARFGEPADDWFFLARFSGPHMEAVLDVIARAMTTSSETLRARCEVREAAYLASDLRAVLEHPDARAPMPADRLRGLEELINGRYWWRRVLDQPPIRFGLSPTRQVVGCTRPRERTTDSVDQYICNLATMALICGFSRDYLQANYSE